MSCEAGRSGAPGTQAAARAPRIMQKYSQEKVRECPPSVPSVGTPLASLGHTMAGEDG